MISKKIFTYSKIVIINIIILFFFLYLIEITINYKNNNLFKKTRIYHLNIQKNKTYNQNVFLNIAGHKFLDNTKISILPLSGYKNSTILLCIDENNKPIFYLSDKNGFNNKMDNTVNDFLLIGDSYVQGMCVNNKNNLNAQFKKHNYITTNLGMAGNGPLLEYATFKEYQNEYEYQDIILFITPDNDFYDLSNEKKNKILMKYINEENFTQKIKENESSKIEVINSYFGEKTERIFNDFLSIYHFNLKELGNTLEKIFKKENLTNNMPNYLEDDLIDLLFLRILNGFNNDAKNKNKKFYVVFNGLNPDILYPNTENENELNRIYIKDKLKKLKIYLNKNNIPYYDFNEYIIKNYNKANITTLFKKINGQWDHYTEKGFLELTKKINTELIK
ncbi:hypothetical protein N8796_00515 [Candidatus Pelagibacter sp.]|nr:hypothetical protein [Candidatus Pelagibacter sp.]